MPIRRTTTAYLADLASFSLFSTNPPGAMSYKNEATCFSCVIDDRYQKEKGEPRPWAFSVRLRVGPESPFQEGQQPALAWTEARLMVGPAGTPLTIADETLTLHPIGLF